MSDSGARDLSCPFPNWRSSPDQGGLQPCRHRLCVRCGTISLRANVRRCAANASGRSSTRLTTHYRTPTLPSVNASWRGSSLSNRSALSLEGPPSTPTSSPCRACRATGAVCFGPRGTFARPLSAQPSAEARSASNPLVRQTARPPLYVLPRHRSLWRQTTPSIGCLGVQKQQRTTRLRNLGLCAEVTYPWLQNYAVGDRRERDIIFRATPGTDLHPQPSRS